MNHFQHFQRNYLQHVTRRHFLRDSIVGLGGLWLAGETAGSAGAKSGVKYDPSRPLAPRSPHFAAKAKRVIYLHMAGAPSQLELFEYKPELERLHGQDCPAEFLQGKRFAFIRGVPKMLGPTFPFHQTGNSGHWISDRLPQFEMAVDKVCFLRTVQTDQFNHAPAQLLLHTGNQNLGYPAIGSWVTYGLGTENQNMPGFIVLVSGGRFPSAGKSAWGTGFLPSVYQGVQCRSFGEPILYLSNPDGINRNLREKIVSTVNRLNQVTYEETGDPETLARIAQYEMAFRMQMAAQEATDIENEPAYIHELYGTSPGEESFANNCLLARRLVERGVRYVQLFDWGWDSHGASQSEALNHGFKNKCEQVDRPMMALLTDLEQRGLLEDTLVVWGGEFGRTPMRENRGGQEMKFVGRDHHPFAFTMWMAGGGVKPGFSHGETDPFGYAPVTDPVLPRDLQATLLHLLGIDHKRLVYPFQGLDQKLTSVRPARVIDPIIA